MRDVSIWTQASENVRKVVQFLLRRTRRLKFNYRVFSHDQESDRRSAGAELVFIRWS